MKLPRDVDGWRLVRALEKFGYSFSRQSGSHYTLTTTAKGEHHITVPLHSPIKVGTLSAILKRLAAHHEKSVAEVLKVLDLYFLFLMESTATLLLVKTRPYLLAPSRN